MGLPTEERAPLGEEVDLTHRSGGPKVVDCQGEHRGPDPRSLDTAETHRANLTQVNTVTNLP